MLIPDINVLVYAFRDDMPARQETLRWLEEVSLGSEELAIPEHVFAGFVRIVTHPRIFANPTQVEVALAFVDELRSVPQYVRVQPTGRCWEIFRTLCVETGARGNQIPDAYLAAIAIDAGATFVTRDRGFARFQRLSWQRPFA